MQITVVSKQEQEEIFRLLSPEQIAPRCGPMRWARVHIISAALDKIAERIAGDANGGGIKAGAGGDLPAAEPGADS
jgi:hypothetical protein